MADPRTIAAHLDAAVNALHCARQEVPSANADAKELRAKLLRWQLQIQHLIDDMRGDRHAR